MLVILLQIVALIIAAIGAVIQTFCKVRHDQPRSGLGITLAGYIGAALLIIGLGVNILGTVKKELDDTAAQQANYDQGLFNAVMNYQERPVEAILAHAQLKRDAMLSDLDWAVAIVITNRRHEKLLLQISMNNYDREDGAKKESMIRSGAFVQGLSLRTTSLSIPDLGLYSLSFDNTAATTQKVVQSVRDAWKVSFYVTLAQKVADKKVISHLIDSLAVLLLTFDNVPIKVVKPNSSKRVVIYNFERNSDGKEMYYEAMFHEGAPDWRQATELARTITSRREPDTAERIRRAWNELNKREITPE